MGFSTEFVPFLFETYKSEQTVSKKAYRLSMESVLLLLYENYALYIT